ncbi:MAG TPA: hypothetical protein VNI20_08075 [Fimbriimonadaceae bacterium]|nr:hypothetical protein [Fimbriimonadaceae bacterium]
MSDGFRRYLTLVGCLFVLRVVLGFVAVPLGMVHTLSVVSSIVFVGVPLYALYSAADREWGSRQGLIVLATGAAMHVAAALLVSYVLPQQGVWTVVAHAFGQTGILFWTLGIGVLLSIFIKDRNLMVPVALFLIGFDAFLVFNPSAPTAKILRLAPRSFTQVALATVPAVKAEGQPMGQVQDLAYVGPADLLFLAAFFCLLFRHRMRTRQTLLWLAPVLIAYLLVVLIFGDKTIGPVRLAMLPAMVPIGVTVLLVNRKEFKFAKQEVGGVIGVALIALLLAAFGIYRAAVNDRQKEQPTAPSIPVDVPVPQAQGGSPAPAR